MWMHLQYDQLYLVVSDSLRGILENGGEESYGNVNKGGEARLNPPLGEIIYMLNKRNIEFVLCVLTSYQYVQYSLCQYICSLLLQSLRSSPKTRHL